MSFVAHASVSVRATRSAVWAALTRAETIEEILPVEVVSPWRAGEAFVWMLEMLGKPYRVDGVVHRYEPDCLLEYDFVDPHTLAFKHVENRHRVTIVLADDEDGTRISVAQSDNLTSAELLHAEGGWRLALNNLKFLVERGSASS